MSSTSTAVQGFLGFLFALLCDISQVEGLCGQIRIDLRWKRRMLIFCLVTLSLMRASLTVLHSFL